MPPRALFPDDPRHRTGLITVPACRQCNRRFSKDDQYFTLAISAHLLTGENPVAATLHPRAKRGHVHAAERPLGRKIARELRLAELRSPEGAFAGYSPVWQYDASILHRVGERILRGLHFHHFGERVRKGSLVMCRPLLDIPMRTDSYDALVRPLRDALRTQPIRNIGPGVFKYRFGVAADNSEHSVWLMTFYEAVEFVGQIEPASGGAE